MIKRLQKTVATLFLLTLFPMSAFTADKTAETSKPADCKPFTPTLTTKTGTTTLESSAVVEAGKQHQDWITVCSGSKDCPPLASKVSAIDGTRVTLTLEQVLAIERQRQLWIDDCAKNSVLRPLTLQTQTGGQKPEPGQSETGGLTQEPEGQVGGTREEPVGPETPAREEPDFNDICTNGYSDLSPSAPVIPGGIDRVIRGESEEDDGADVTLRWGPGYSGRASNCAYITPPDSYRICAFRGSDCYSTGSRQIWDDIPASQTQMAVTMARGPFQGEDFHWAVLACSENAGCGDFSTHQPLRYMLPPPTDFWISTTVRNDLDPENPFSVITFRWSSVAQAELYFLCVKNQGQYDQCDYLKTGGTYGDPYIKHTTNLGYTIDDNLRQFRGNTVEYTVAACTSADEPTAENCSYYQTPKTFNYPDPQ